VVVCGVGVVSANEHTVIFACVPVNMAWFRVRRRVSCYIVSVCFMLSSLCETNNSCFLSV
jgi:hypothetical protein